MARSGVQSVRVAFNWAQAQPYRPGSAAPDGYVKVGGVPTTFLYTDELVSAAALYGLRVLPVVIYTPWWDAGKNPRGDAPPSNVSYYANYLTALIHRYGPRGSFWSSYSPRLPIRQWQIWNEPNIWQYWPQPSTSSYVKLLRAAHTAIIHADSGASTVMAALTNYSWTYLAGIYKVAGARSSFNEVAANPFTLQPAGVVTILSRVRQTMKAHGDGAKPLIASEVGWTSEAQNGHTHYAWDSTLAGQASKDSQVMSLLAANRRSLGLAGFFIYTWVGDESHGGPDFNWAGLERVTRAGVVVRKPAFFAFASRAHALER
jgi:hypothetical protein